jgi:hypothetical protein
MARVFLAVGSSNRMILGVLTFMEIVMTDLSPAALFLSLDEGGGLRIGDESLLVEESRNCRFSSSSLALRDSSDNNANKLADEMDTKSSNESSEMKLVMLDKSTDKELCRLSSCQYLISNMLLFPSLPGLLCGGDSSRPVGPIETLSEGEARLVEEESVASSTARSFSAVGSIIVR